jgi:hypothetical protein
MKKIQKCCTWYYFSKKTQKPPHPHTHIEMSRQEHPAKGCKASMEGLLASDLKEIHNCTNCSELGILCWVSNHPHRAGIYYTCVLAVLLYFISFHSKIEFRSQNLMKELNLLD